MQDSWWQEGPVEAQCFTERSQFAMISFYVDPQWCGLLFSVYCRHEKGCLLGGGGFPQADAFATCSLAGPPLDADWIAITGSVGFEICRLSSTWALIFESVKATGVILLLGVGSLVCYKICNHYWSRPRPRPRPHPHSRDALVLCQQTQDSEDQLLEDLEDGELSDVEGRYFGPNPMPGKGELPTDTSSSPCSRSASGSMYSNSSTSQSDSSTSGEDDGRDADVSEGSQGGKSPKHLHVLQQQQKHTLHWSGHFPLQSKSCSLDASTRGLPRQLPHNNSGWLTDKISKILTSTPDRLQLSGSAWLNLPSSQNRAIRLSHAEAKTLGSDLRLDWRDDFYLTGHRRLAPEGAEIKPQEGSINGDSNSTSWTQNMQSSTSLTRDESYDSLGFSNRLPRDGSFDSTFSELSLDFSLPESSADVDTGTMLCMEKLQQEIDQLKTNCQKMDAEFETIKCNRNLPGMSSLMKANASSNNLASNTLDSNVEKDAGHQESLKQEKARACFAGLYSLTTIKNSTSSELSDSFSAPLQGLGGQGSIGSAESLDWDSPRLAASPTTKPQVDVSSPTKHMLGHFILEDSSPIAASNLLLSQSDDKSNLVPTPSEDELMANLEWDEEDLMEYPETGEGGIAIVAVGTHELDLQAELGPIVHNMSQEPESMTSSCSFIASPNTERSSKMESSSGFESGSKMLDSCTSQMADDLGMKAWTYWSSEESGCMEWDTTITATAGHGKCDQNFTQQCWDKATVTAQSSSNPSELSTPGSENPQSLSAFVLPPALENVGQRVNVFQYAVQEWQGNTKKAKTILQGYSEIPSLLGLQHIRQIRGDNYCGVRAAIFQTLAQGLHVPSGERTFQCLSQAISNEGCGWLQDWTFAGRLPYQGSNVLHGMEVCLRNLDNVVEMFLLGYTLEVTLRVIRPAAFGTEDFICSYPDWNEGNWPQVFLIAEDDRHYNVLVN